MPTNEIINQWGPAVIVCLTIIVGLIFSNQRISDLKDSINQRFTDLEKYLDIKFKSIEDRLDKLENPIKIK